MARTILVYGGSGGIGAAIARRIRQNGDIPHLAGRNGTALKNLAEELEIRFTVGTVEEEDFFIRATQEATSDGTLAGLIYAVGTITLKSLARLKVQDFESDFRVNALGAALAVQHAAPLLKAFANAHEPETAGILLFSSVAAHQGFASHASIGMAKGAVEGLALALAAELAPKIRVNVIAPSLTRTALAAPLVANPAMSEAIGTLHALPRLGTPDDIAPLAVLLCGPQASWITGQVIGVDGGRASLRTKG
jgi:NAD(P)-dependent dehydrogenase (short-subunit alcohol dehydrogenase family)